VFLLPTAMRKKQKEGVHVRERCKGLVFFFGRRKRKKIKNSEEFFPPDPNILTCVN